MKHYVLLSMKRAILNIWRNIRRSAITVLMILIGTVAVILLGGYFRIMQIGLRDSAINNQYGHLQIAAAGYFDAVSTNRDYLLDEKTIDDLAAHLRADRSVDLVNRRLFLSGLVGNASVSTFFSATCGDPDAESLMLPTLLDGSVLSSDDQDGIVIGKKMADALGVSVGSHLTLMLTTAEGAQEAIAVHVRGIYRGLLKEQEQVAIYMPLQAAQDLMRQTKVHSLTVLLKSSADLDRVVAETRRYIAQKGWRLELRSWDQLAVYFKQIMGLLTSLATFGGVIVFIVIIFGISNTMYIAVAERTKEIGTTRALGDSRGDVLFSFLLEGSFLGILGAAIGTIVSLAAIPIINSAHILLPPGPGQDNPIPIVLMADRTFILAALALDIITAAIASILPALSAARKSIADALRTA
jgi:ABC-type transport system, involved in lipoprotein release, permease component